MQAKLKLGVTSWKAGDDWSAEALCAQAETAEAMGVHSFWLPENHFGDSRTMPSPLTLLAAVAARTENILLGTVSYLLPIRHPILAAEEVAVLDQLSKGRTIIGVGRGIQTEVFNAFDIPSKEKRLRFADNLETMCRAWEGQAVANNATGEPVYLAPLPVQKPYPPIWVAAFGPLALRQVGSLGLPYLASPVETLSALEENYLLYRKAVEEAGLAAVVEVPVMRTVYVSSSAAEVKELKSRLGKVVTSSISDPAAAVEDWAIVGDSHYVKDELQGYQQSLGMTHLIASGRLPGVEADQVVRSHALLCECLP